VSHAGGYASDSANALLPQIPDTIYRWSQRLNIAATQADVVAHSFGGVVLRVAATLQRDSSLGEDPTVNFRALTNWGHGPVHKLITLGTTHRGAAVVNHIARLNLLRGGKVARWLDDSHWAINKGALEDQFVAYGAQRLLRTATPFPGHAIAGQCEYSQASLEQFLYKLMRLADVSTGPYEGAFAGTQNEDQGYRRMANYVFNMNYNQSADLDTGHQPSYDLVVSTKSARGGMTGSATSTLNGGGVTAMLSHTAEPSGAFLQVSDRVELLLRSATTSSYFRPFPPFDATYSLAELSMQSLVSPSALYLTDGSAASAAGPAVVLTTSAENYTVSVGQTFTASVTWPGKTLQSTLILWPAPGGVGSAWVQGAAPSTSIHVAPGVSATFPVTAVVKTTDGALEEAKVILQVEDHSAYSALATEPQSLRLDSGYPARLRVYGQLEDGGWQDVTEAARTHLTSGDPNVAAVQPDGTVRPVGKGSTTIGVAVDGAGSLSVLVTVTVNPPSLPAAPSGLTAVALSEAEVRLDWSDHSANEDGFQVERKEPGGVFSVISQVGAGVRQFQDAGVAALGSYAYRVRAVNSGGASDYTAEAQVSVPAPAGGKLTVAKSINFGKVKPGKSKEKTLKIKNGDRRASLLVRLGTVEGSGYSLSESGLHQLPPRGTLSLKVRFSPTAAGTANGVLPIFSSDARKPTAPVKLKGRGG
jgi:hypothetical protein